MGVLSDFLKLIKEKKSRWIVLIVALAIAFLGAAGGITAGALVKRSEAIEKTIAEAGRLSASYMYDEALIVLENAKISSKKTDALITEIKAKKNELKEYDGKVYHVFFHSLIVYPELAFDGDYMHEGYDMWMTTVSEFKAMLPELYNRGFVLYPLNELQADKKILLPEGKKPLIISVDDVNYYDYMENDGFADRLLVDEAGNIVCEVKTPSGDKILSYDGDVMPILDKFVDAHPDFSYKGAKGVVAVTGYEGAFGYNFIKAEGEEKETLKAEAKKVAGALKNTGWLIACHSYTHNNYFKDGGVSNEELEYDTNRFKERIYEMVLNPDIYISPFGYHLHEGDERLSYLKEMGYNYFCPVSSAMRTIYTKEDVVISERFNLDRYNMRSKKEFINNLFFDVDKVYYIN